MKSAGGRSRFDFDKPSMRGGVAFWASETVLGFGTSAGASERVGPALAANLRVDNLAD